MIDLGIDDPEVGLMLSRAVAIIENQIGPTHEKLYEPVPDSEIYRLHNELPPGPLNIVNALEATLLAGVGSLQQISTLITRGVPTSPTALQSLLRTAIISSARLVHVLLPPDPETRLKSARSVLALDAKSGARALGVYENFQGMQSVKAPEELVEKFQTQLQNLYPSGRVPGEGAGITKMVSALSNAYLVAGLEKEFSHSILVDHSQWLWNTYSGLAHAYMWPHLAWNISGDRRMPGDFSLDLFMTANSFYIGQLAHENRAKQHTAGTTENVSLS